MYPPIFTLLKAAAGVTAIIGTAPCRAYSFGNAPDLVAKPYMTWQAVGGNPENYLKDAPNIDRYSLQVDCWALTDTEARALALAARDALQGDSYITSWTGESRDPDTKNYRYSFDVDFYVNR